MRAVLLASGLVVALGAGATVGRAASCPDTGEHCVTFVACIEETGEHFKGYALGHDAGTLAATSSLGASCTGNWWRTLLGLGRAEFSCDDGRSGSSLYTWFDRDTGTAIGSGQFADGARARFWSGSDLERYFRETDPDEVQRMKCQPRRMLIG